MSSLDSRIAIGFVSLAAFVGCTKVEMKPAAKHVDPEVAVSTTIPAGSIRGTVVFDGVAPERKPVPMGGVASCAAHAGKVLTETVIVNAGKLQNVLVYVKSGLDPANVPAILDVPVVLEQHDCVYQPHVLALRVGQKLLVKNDDGFNHNVNAKAQRNDQGKFNQTQAGGAPPIEVVFDKPEQLIPFGCDIHPWMRSYVHVIEHPYFAISGADGSFSIDKLPPGKYRIDALHEKLDGQSAEVVLDGSSGAQVTFHFHAAN